MPRVLTACLLLALGCFTVLPQAEAAEQFTPAQRAEIIAIVRQALKTDPSILRDAVAAMQAQDAKSQAAQTREILQAHRDLLVTPADPVAGNPHGAVTIVEFFDTRCPYCRQLEPVVDKLVARDHDVKLVYKDLPILGPQSVLGSEALLAAQQQGGYNKLRAAVMKMPPDTTLPMVEAAAKKLGLDWPKMKQAMNGPTIKQRIDNNLELARALGIDGTPALVIGDTLIPGAVTYAELQRDVAAAHQTAKP